MCVLRLCFEAIEGVGNVVTLEQQQCKEQEATNTQENSLLCFTMSLSLFFLLLSLFFSLSSLSVSLSLSLPLSLPSLSFCVCVVVCVCPGVSLCICGACIMHGTCDRGQPQVSLFPFCFV